MLPNSPGLHCGLSARAGMDAVAIFLVSLAFVLWDLRLLDLFCIQ